MRSPSVLCALACLACIVQSRGLETAKQTSELPIVEISLAAPMQPWPHISADAGELEGSRELLEKSMMSEVQTVAQQALRRVDQKIRVITDRLLRSLEDPALGKVTTLRFVKRVQDRNSKHVSSVSFLSRKYEIQQGDDTVKVKVLKGVAPDSLAIGSKIRSLEQNRRKGESQFFRQAAEEIDELASSFIAELQAQIDKQVRALPWSSPDASRAHSASFLQVSESEQANIRVVASDLQYPTVGEMVSDMEKRRDVAENLARQKVAIEKLMFLQAANAMTKDRLEAVVGVIHRRLQAAAK